MPLKPQPADIFAAIAEPRRREVIALLADSREHTVNDIVLHLQIAQPSVSKHLGALRKAGIVTVTKRGQHRMYRLHAASLKPIHDWVKHFERHWTHQLSEIKQRAEFKARQRKLNT